MGCASTSVLQDPLYSSLGSVGKKPDARVTIFRMVDGVFLRDTKSTRFGGDCLLRTACQRLVPNAEDIELFDVLDDPVPFTRIYRRTRVTTVGSGAATSDTFKISTKYTFRDVYWFLRNRSPWIIRGNNTRTIEAILPARQCSKNFLDPISKFECACSPLHYSDSGYTYVEITVSTTDSCVVRVFQGNTHGVILDEFSSDGQTVHRSFQVKRALSSIIIWPCRVSTLTITSTDAKWNPGAHHTIFPSNYPTRDSYYEITESRPATLSDYRGESLFFYGKKESVGCTPGTARDENVSVPVGAAEIAFPYPFILCANSEGGMTYKTTRTQPMHIKYLGRCVCTHPHSLVDACTCRTQQPVLSTILVKQSMVIRDERRHKEDMHAKAVLTSLGQKIEHMLQMITDIVSIQDSMCTHTLYGYGALRAWIFKETFKLLQEKALCPVFGQPRGGPNPPDIMVIYDRLRAEMSRESSDRRVTKLACRLCELYMSRTDDSTDRKCMRAQNGR